MSIIEVTPDTLNSRVEFESAFRILSGSRIEDSLSEVFAPEVYLYVDKNGFAVSEEEIDMRPWYEATEWEVVNGYSGQYGCAGPTMHASEYLGGSMAKDVLEDVGSIYMVVSVECLPNFEASEEEDMLIRDNPAGWMLLKKK